MNSNSGHEVVVHFKGKCDKNFEPAYISKPCYCEIYGDYIKIIIFINSEENDEKNFEFHSFSQVNIEGYIKESKNLLWKTKQHYLKISIDYTHVGGNVIFIGTVTVNEEDFGRIMKRYEICKANSINVSSETTSIINSIDLLDGIEFEKFLSDLFSKMGYKVDLTKTTGDQGVDLLLYKGNDSIAVQAKCYSDKVGNAAVQQVVAGMNYYSTNKSMVVTNNFYTDSAVELAKSTGTLLWDRLKLEEMIRLLY